MDCNSRPINFTQGLNEEPRLKMSDDDYVQDVQRLMMLLGETEPTISSRPAKTIAGPSTADVIMSAQARLSEFYEAVLVKARSLTPGEECDFLERLTSQSDNGSTVNSINTQPREEKTLDPLHILRELEHCQSIDKSRKHTPQQVRDEDAVGRALLLTRRDEWRSPASRTPTESSILGDILELFTFPQQEFEKGAMGECDLQRYTQRQRERVQALIDEYVKERMSMHERTTRKERNTCEKLVDPSAFPESRQREALAASLVSLASDPMNDYSLGDVVDEALDDVVGCMAFPEQQCVKDGHIYDQHVSEKVSRGRVVAHGDRLECMEVIEPEQQLEAVVKYQPTPWQKILDFIPFPEEGCGYGHTAKNAILVSQ
jgi:hypothetical protein